MHHDGRELKSTGLSLQPAVPIFCVPLERRPAPVDAVSFIAFRSKRVPPIRSSVFAYSASLRLLTTAPAGR